MRNSEARPRHAGDYGADLAPGERRLAAYAASSTPSRGRLIAEPACPTRSPWQRDRDRIVHSTAFRRLTYKTQMFLFHEGDHYRTRLTHSIEVAQIARTIARQLLLDEDLAEALALAHDLGHPPFGHAGERALDEAMRSYSGFDHNVQSFRLVTSLERKYPGFDGLNLTWEALEGLVKHNGPPARDDTPGGRRLCHALRNFEERMSLALGRQGSAEAQVAALADDIAWMTHDIDDGLRAGLIVPEDLRSVPVLAPLLSALDRQTEADMPRLIYDVVRRLITTLVADAVADSRDRLSRLGPGHPDDIRGADGPVVGFSGSTRDKLGELRSFLFARLYRNPRVLSVMQDAEAIVRDLIARYLADASAMPDNWRAASAGLPDRRRARLVADFVAGMTDRYAVREHRRLFDHTPELR
jgi:dGTPase